MVIHITQLQISQIFHSNTGKHENKKDVLSQSKRHVFKIFPEAKTPHLNISSKLTLEKSSKKSFG